MEVIDDQVEPRALHLHTVETLLNDLAGGHSIGIGGDNESFKIESLDTRTILEWYNSNQDRWKSNINDNVANSIIDNLDKELPLRALSVGADEDIIKKKYTLKSIRAYRFAGLHNCGTIGNPPPIFEYSPHKKTSLLEGRNGSGKTSVLNAIIWALTGKLIRPQRVPESGLTSFEYEYDDQGQEHSTKITAISPLPIARNCKAEDSWADLDTWVELTFEVEGEVANYVVKRHQTLSGKKPKETIVGIEELNLDPIAFQTGTIMPGLLPYIQIGSKSDLGIAVSKLTGLSSLVDLSHHANRARKRISSVMTKSQESSLVNIDLSYERERKDLETKLLTNTSLETWIKIPKPSAFSGIEEVLVATKTYYDRMKSKSLLQAQDYLGKNFDPTNYKLRSNLESNVDAAISELNQISRMDSAKRLASFSKVSEEDLSDLEALISQILTDAKQLIELSKDSSKAARIQLYALLSEWADENNYQSDIDECPVCQTDLKDKFDDVTGTSLIEHLKLKPSDARLLSLSMSRWAETVEAQISQKLHADLKNELTTELPKEPFLLIKRALTDELFATTPLTQSLHNLKKSVESLCENNQSILSDLGPIIDTRLINAPDSLASLQQKLDRLAKIIAFARWRKKSGSEIVRFFNNVIGSKTEDQVSNNLTASLREQLSKLKGIVESAEPINEVLICCERLIEDLQKRRRIEHRLTKYERTITALDDVVQLGSFAQKQVEQLQSVLKDKTEEWRTRIYQQAFPATSHKVKATNLSSTGELDIKVELQGGVAAPIEHVTNASALRASLTGFFFAFWQYVLEERGGLRILLLDDPQELLDSENRDRLAEAVPKMVNSGGQVLITSYDRHFARRCSVISRATTGIDHRSIHPITQISDVIGLAPSILCIDDKREIYEADINNEKHAREYLNSVRVYVECCLSDFFTSTAFPAASDRYPGQASLMNHIDRLKGLVNTPPDDLFRQANIRKLAGDVAFQEGSIRDLLNKPHHSEDVTASDVNSISVDLKRVTGFARNAHDDYRRWATRMPQVLANDNQAIVLECIPPLDFKLPVNPDLAAFASFSTGIASQATFDDYVEGSFFEDKSLYYLKTDNLGYAAPAGSVAIVNSSSGSVEDGRLVIAKANKKWVGRRLLKNNETDFLTLVSEKPDPRNRMPSLILPQRDVSLHQVVGVLFNQTPPAHTGSHEVVLTTDSGSLSTVKAAYKVRDDSAVPLALDGQIVLGGERILNSELQGRQGQIVVVTDSNGENFFKRVGSPLGKDLSKFIQFEAIGGLGSSLVLSMDEDQNGVPRVISAREIIGVLY